MNFSTVPSLDKRKSSDLLAIPFYQGKKPILAAELEELAPDIKAAVESGDFKAKEAEVLVVYTGSKKEKRIALVGLGKKSDVTVEVLRRSYSAVVKSALARKATTLNIIVPKDADELQLYGIAEGLTLSNYVFEDLKGDKSKDTPLVKKCGLIGVKPSFLKYAKKAAQVTEGVHLSRNLINGNADDINPQKLSDVARKMAKDHQSLHATVFDKKRIEKEKMGLLLAVNRGSSCDPAFIILEYKGNPRSKDKTVIVGKGITYDTGGLNLKPTGSMETMKADMGGAAVVLGTMQAIVNIGLKKNVTMVIPSTENSIGKSSYKPGDVYTSYSGKTVEIGNTDAEGRLVLADALSYTVEKLKPSRIIDFATLTGAMVVALGEITTGMMSNDDALAEMLTEAGQTTYERVWRFPLFDEYRKALKSDFADIKNVGGRAGGSITAAKFLQEFVGDTPWAHFDIAGTAYQSKAGFYHPKNGTGIGVRMMVDFLENHA